MHLLPAGFQDSLIILLFFPGQAFPSVHPRRILFEARVDFKAADRPINMVSVHLRGSFLREESIGL